MRAAILFLILILTTLCGCSHLISPQGRAAVTPNLHLDMVRADSQAYLGQALLVGGNILSITPEVDSTTLEIYSWQLDDRGEPTYHDPQGGRFLALSKEPLDLEDFKPGHFVTLVGTVEGVENQDIDEVSTTLPKLQISEIRLLDRGLRYDGPPRLNGKTPFPSPPWYEAENPYDPNNSRPARDRMSPPYGD